MAKQYEDGCLAVHGTKGLARGGTAHPFRMKQLDVALRHDLQSVSMHGFSRGRYPAAIRVVG
jgi:hypothetical protein